MTRIKFITKVLVFISLGLLLGGRLWSGSLNYYIHPRFNWLIAVTAAVFILVGIIYAIQHRHQLLGGGPDHDHDHDHAGHDHDHSHHGHSHEVTWLGLAILMVPVFFGVAIEPKPLGAPALANREVNAGKLASAQAPGGSSMAFIATDGERNILDWLYLFQTSDNPADFDGQEAFVLGFVYRDERFEPSQFMISRFTVSCCVADAIPVGLVVVWPEATSLAADEWVEVRGRFEEREFDGYRIPILIAESITPALPPPQPYLYQ